SDSFQFTVNNGTDTSPPGTITITVAPVNDAPVAANDTATTDEDTDVTVDILGNDVDAEFDTLTPTITIMPSNGVASVNLDGSVSYSPDADFHGTDSFTYEISDGNGGSDSATATITVNPVNDEPVAADDTATTDEDTDVNITVLTNDSDIDLDALSPSVTTQPSNGTAAVNAN
ncbi:unnamed protein product, partial [Laminaria digitata]